ncbi:MAG TPA: sugar transferase [Longimicrobium sp.]|uniref:sugar transferase n=1 Tax=Longimicrobium sp. TaxID=2029185 RepID=UPI002EDADC23
MKRVLDVLVSGAALLAASPVLALAAAGILLEDGRPLLFVQPRAGRGGRVFHALKFRTMRVHQVPAHQMAQVRAGDPLVTRVGSVLRRLKVDELPQLVNVLRGDMSLVGPRPTLPEQVAGYDAFQRRRLEVTPGLTGWAQVNGNTELDWPERILLDVWYVDHRSLWLDLRILARTLAVVVGGERVRSGPLEQARLHAHGSGRGG